MGTMLVHYALTINNRIQIVEITPVSSTGTGIQSNILAF